MITRDMMHGTDLSDEKVAGLKDDDFKPHSHTLLPADKATHDQGDEAKFLNVISDHGTY